MKPDSHIKSQFGISVMYLRVAIRQVLEVKERELVQVSARIVPSHTCKYKKIDKQFVFLFPTCKPTIIFFLI